MKYPVLDILLNYVPAEVNKNKKITFLVEDAREKYKQK